MYRQSIAAAALLLFVAVTNPPPAFAQFSLTGDWRSPFYEDALERGPGPELGDYTGLPVTPAARFFADHWDASTLTLPEHQCRPHSGPYTMRGPLNMRIWEEKDPHTQRLIAIKLFVATFAQTRTIYMDGRPHPSINALHTWQGFSTGRWDGNRLTVTTTHIKPYFIRRNGLPQSDRAELTEHFIRHGNYMTHTNYVRDVYLSEPLMKTETYILNPNAREDTYQTHLSCQPDEEIFGRTRGYVPHHLPRAAPRWFEEFGLMHKIPFEQTRGGAGSMYPEFRTAREHAVAPPTFRPSPALASPTKASSGVLDVLKLRDDVYVVAGAGGNVTVQFGPMGALLVDTGAPQQGARILEALEGFTNEPIRYIIDTSVDPDHAGGNEPLSKAGAAIPARELRNQAAVLIAHENVLARMSAPGQQAQTPPAAWPMASFVVPRKDLFFNAQGIEIHHVAAAHTDGDAVVFFRRSDVLSAGDVFNMNQYPEIDVQKGGTINGIVAALNHLLDMAIAGEKVEGGTIIVPGHGRLADEADLVDYRDMITIIRDRVQDLKNRGLTLAQVQAEKPTQDFDPRFAPSAGPATVETFVEAIYTTLEK